jgi:hypothetical protein
VAWVCESHDESNQPIKKCRRAAETVNELRASSDAPAIIILRMQCSSQSVFFAISVLRNQFLFSKDTNLILNSYQTAPLVKKFPANGSHNNQLVSITAWQADTSIKFGNPNAAADVKIQRWNARGI